ncbi:MAG: MoxR family ATPase [Bifidobacteriaceae bacterium]|jgi:MoxR-like ATPase|nr:MoxR family ATPase [Bifidobacteriaceae bacterium]
MQSQIPSHDLDKAKSIISNIDSLYSQKVVGQGLMKETLLCGLLSGGHILIESVPGLAKTTAASALAHSISGSFKRIQCTPDLMPNDIVGTQIYNFNSSTFTTQLGPVHANVVLLDEINRSSAKTQSAMLEAMQEGQTTIGGKDYKLPQPFMVLATQNPIEEEGTYILPEAQLDRFLLKTIIEYPTKEEEKTVLSKIVDGSQAKGISGSPASLDDIKFLINLARKVHISENIYQFIIDIISASRPESSNIQGLDLRVRVGASPRGSIAFAICSQSLALLRGRDYVIPEDIQDLKYSVLRHRLVRTFDALADEITPESIIDDIFSQIQVP